MSMPMLMPRPEFLRKLVDEYEALQAGDGTAAATAERAARLRDCAYTLCVLTGTRDVTGALAAARLRLVAPHP
ncbi:DUF5133 domain-containing protein [Streptomyces sp. YIM S03343]